MDRMQAITLEDDFETLMKRRMPVTEQPDIFVPGVAVANTLAPEIHTTATTLMRTLRRRRFFITALPMLATHSIGRQKPPALRPVAEG